ncbi:MAG: hypothetical protein EXS36_18950 [Pedosphaera sp.]|nr:hypothetical protein [Pedosphaera sp.]
MPRFTDNNKFLNGRRLEQDPIYGADAHRLYTLRPELWLASSVGYGGGGGTAVNGVSSDNRQSNLGCGIGLGIPINRALGVEIADIGTRTQARTGLAADAFTCAFSMAW